MKNFLFTLFIFNSFFLFSQTEKEVELITSRYDLQTLNQLENSFKQSELQNKEFIVQLKQNESIETFLILEDGGYAELQQIDADGNLLYYKTYNVDAARSTRTNHLNSGGSLGLNLMGQNMRAHVWDAGIARASHQEYHGAGGNNRYSVGDGNTTLNSHAAHVTGTIMASGVVSSAKGMAPHSSVTGYDWNNDLSEAVNAAANGMLISNHSYGYRSDLLPSYYFGAYITNSRDWDALHYNAPYYLMVVAAGNDGTTNYNTAPLDPSFPQFDKLTGHSTSKNNLVVASSQDANINSQGDLISVNISSFSSQGPTDDYRIKPDITGNGQGVYSTYQNSNTAYSTISGTSMASPNVSGSLLLLQEHAQNMSGNYMRAATLKGLVLHTADDAGMVGPDAIFGWGLLNAKRAAKTITNNGNESIISELTLFPGQTYSIEVDSDGLNNLMASISWTDPAGTATTALNNTSPRLVNDLDIRVTQGGNTYFPWRLTGVNSNDKGDNIRDPFERVDILNASGTYTITVTHKGSLTGGSQNYTLIVTGLTSDPVVCIATIPEGLTASGVGSNSAILNWNSVAGATYDLRYRLEGSSIWTTLEVIGSSKTITGLLPESNYEAQIKSKCPDGTNSAFSSTFIFTTQEIQLEYCDSKGLNVTEEYISRVELNTLDNISGGSNGYSDFTNLSTDLVIGQTYTITITPAWTGTVYPEGYAVWIDYNKDGNFTDSTELVWMQSPTTNSPVSGTFTVPAGAMDGQTRMRVSMKYNGVPTSCELIQWGEVEDYTVTIIAEFIDSEPPTPPTNLLASNITDSSLMLSWEASTDNVAVSSYDVYMDNALVLSTQNTFANITDLSPNTTYSFFVKAKDAAGNVSESSNVVSATTQIAQLNYCDSYSTNSNNEWIQRVQLGSINNISGNDGGYGNYLHISATLTKGSTNTITITPGWSGNRQRESYRVWIDYNQDGSFDGSGEQVLNINRSNAASVSANFTIPQNAIEGPTRMRVSMKRNSLPGSCEIFSNGEVEDYTVTIIGGFIDSEPPTPPTNLLASNITDSSLMLSWEASTDNVAVSSYDVYMDNALVLSTQNTFANITDLSPNTTYSFFVKAKDAAGNVSESSNVVSATTQIAQLNYCDSYSTNSNNEWIQRVQLGSINNISGNDGGYGNYLHISATLTKGSTNTITITPGWSGNSQRESYRVWIDYNQDGSFDGSGEQVLNINRSNASSVSANFTIPQNAIEGPTRMRVSMKRNSLPGSCEIFSNGEVEDYTVYITNNSGNNFGNMNFFELDTDFIVFPNPVKDKDLNLILNNVNATEIKIINSIGQIILIQEFNEKIDVSSLKNGIYFIEVRASNGHIFVQRFIKE
jgi:trimeric autotransporter adhesin